MTSAEGPYHGQSVASICRLCFMEREQLVPIFGEDCGYLSGWIEKLTSLKITNVPNAPASLCSDCKSTLGAFEEFRDMCITNDRVFNETFCQNLNHPADLSAGIIKVECDESVHITRENNPSTGIVSHSDGQIDRNEIHQRDVADDLESSKNIQKSGISLPDQTVVIEGYEILMINRGLKQKTSSEYKDPVSEIEVQENSAQKAVGTDIAQTKSKFKSTPCRKPKCKLCCKYTSKLHLKTHKAPGVFQCLICSQKFERFFYVSKHIRKWHNETDGQVATQSVKKIRKDLFDKKDKLSNTKRSKRKKKGNDPTQLTNSDSIRSPIIQATQPMETNEPIMESKETEENSCDKDEKPIYVIEIERSALSEDKKNTADQINKTSIEHNRHDCKVCNKTRSKLHSMTHKSKGVFQCYRCDKKFQRVENVSRHIRLHGKKRLRSTAEEAEKEELDDSEVCKVCSRGATKLHVMTHKAKGLFVCYICNRSFPKFESVSKHVNWHYKKLKNGSIDHVVQLVENQRIDPAKYGLKSVEVISMPNDPESSNQEESCTGRRRFPFIHGCKVCKKYVSKLHLMTHKTKDTFVCYVCSKSFKQFDYLRVHLKMHERLKSKEIDTNMHKHASG